MTDRIPSPADRERSLHGEIASIEKATTTQIAALQAAADKNRREVTLDACNHVAAHKREADAERDKARQKRDEARRTADKIHIAAMREAERVYKQSYKDADRVFDEERMKIGTKESEAIRPLHVAIAEAEETIAAKLADAISAVEAAAFEKAAPIVAELTEIEEKRKAKSVTSEVPLATSTPVKPIKGKTSATPAT